MPYFVNNDYVIAEIIYSTAHVHHEVLVLGHGLCAVCIYELHLESGGNYCCIVAVSVELATRGENTECLLLWLLCQPGEKKSVCSFYGLSNLLPASSLTLTYPGFSGQCAQ